MPVLHIWGLCTGEHFPDISIVPSCGVPVKHVQLHFLRHWFICNLPDMNYPGLWPAFFLLLQFLYAHVIFPISLLNKEVPINFCLAGQREPELSATVPLLFTGDIHSLRKCKLNSFLLMLFLCSFPSSHVLFSFHNLDPQVELHCSLDSRRLKNLWILHIHQNIKEIMCP